MNTTTAPLTIVQAKYVAALGRAKTERLGCRKVAEGVWEVASGSGAGHYTVRAIGAHWAALTCTCAGGEHVACKHRAVAAWCRQYHVRSITPRSEATSPTASKIA